MCYKCKPISRGNEILRGLVTSLSVYQPSEEQSLDIMQRQFVLVSPEASGIDDII